jgi:Zn-dependent protease with chaperone function
MDFFAQQDQSRTRSLYLTGLFVLAVILVAVAVYFAVQLAFYLSMDKLNISMNGFKWLHGKMFLMVTVATLAVIGMGSLFKTLQLKKGGSYVAEHLGGRRINRLSADKDEKRLLNVVEEMAIASGVPVPQVYLLAEEAGINAFAAGYVPGDAAIAVTRGCLTTLNREQLQGVIAHEFSHVLNGDMRLNVRLIGFLYGIMVIAIVGRGLMRGSRRSRNNKGGGQTLILALALVIVGYLGQLFGRMIQSAVSRQREFLADASAVQFTRNPGGIAGALKIIGGFSKGSRIESPNAHEASHLFFSTAIRSLFATHPPLEERIRRIDPNYSGFVSAADPGFNETASRGRFDASVSMMDSDSREARQHVGHLTPQHVNYSAQLLSALPEKIRDELDDLLGATAIVCGLLLDRDSKERKNQLRVLEKRAPAQVTRQTRMLEKELSGLKPVFYLPVLELAMPTLRCLSAAQIAGLKGYIQALVEADGKLTLFEFVLEKIVAHQLGMADNHLKRQPIIKRLDILLPQMVTLLSMLAKSGNPDIEDAQKAFKAGLAQAEPLGVTPKETLLTSVSFREVGLALDGLGRAAPNIKRVIFDACCACILFDKKVSIPEAELLRATAAVMDIPVPPFLFHPVGS